MTKGHVVVTAPQPSLVYMPHPLLAAAGRELKFVPFAPGESIAGYLDRVGVRPGPRPVLLCLNDAIVPHTEWRLTFPKPGDLITVRALAHGGDGGSDVIRVVALIAVAIVAAYVAGPQGLALTGWQAGAVTGAITVAGSLLVNALMPIRTPQMRDGKQLAASPTYSLSGGSNRARPFEPMPLLMGKHRMFADYGARFYTEFDGDDQYLNQVFHFGLSDALLTEFRIGTTPLESFEDVRLEISGEDGRLTLFPGDVDTQPGAALTAAASWVSRTSAPDATALAVEVTGTMFYSGDNGIESRSAQIEIQYRAVGAPSWETFAFGQAIVGYHTHYWSAGYWSRRIIYVYQRTGAPTPMAQDYWVQVAYGSVAAGQYTEGQVYSAAARWRYRPYAEILRGGLNILGGQRGLTEPAPQREIYADVPQITIRSASRNPLRLTYRREVQRGQYEIRVRRITADETDARAVSDLVWSQMRTYQPDDTDYTGQLRVALRIKASGQLQGVVDQLSAIGSARSPIFNEGGERLLDSGTAQAGSATTLTLAAGAVTADDVFNSYTVRLEDGTGRERVITDSDAATDVVTVESAWAVNHITRSEELDNAAWSKRANVTVTANQGPAGFEDLDRIVNSVSGGAVNGAYHLGVTAPVAGEVWHWSGVIACVSGSANVYLRTGPSGGPTSSQQLFAVTETPQEVSISYTVPASPIGNMYGEFSPASAGVQILAGRAHMRRSTESDDYVKADATAITLPTATTTYEIIEPDWPVVEHSNPAFWFLAFARGRFIASRRVWGAGLADARIDIEGLKAWGAWCELKGLTFNFVFDQAQSIFEALEMIAAAGRAQVSWATGKLGVVWDMAGKPVVASFGMSNIRRRSMEVNYVTGKLADEVVVRFVNPDMDWQFDTVRATVPGVSLPSRSVELTVPGITDVAMAGRHANLLAAQQAFRRRMITFETDLEGLPGGKGDVVALSHDLTRWGYSGRLTGGTTSVLELDREVPFTPGPQHYIAITFPNGYRQVFAVQFQAGPSSTITLEEPWPATDDLGNTLYAPGADPNHPALDYQYQFDPKATPGKKVLVTQMQPLGAQWMRLTATDEDDGYYLAESAAYQHPTPPAAGIDLPVIGNVQITEELVAAGSIYLVRLTISWEADGPYGGAQATAQLEDTPVLSQATLQRRVEFIVPDAGVAHLEVRLLDPRGRWDESGRYTAEYTILGKAAKPPDVTEFTINGDVLDWKCPKPADFAGYQIRFHQGVNRSWDDATPLHRDLIAGAPYRMIDRPSGPVTLMIRQLDTSGNESANAAVILTDLGDPLVANVVEAFDLKALGWPGAVTGGAVVAFDLAADEEMLFYSSNANAAMYGQDTADFYPAAVYSAMQYETAELQLQNAGPGSSLTLAHTIAGTGIVIEWRRVGPGAFYADTDADAMYGDDADPFYDPAPGYVPWPGFSAIEEEMIQFRITTGFGGVRGVISALTPAVDMPDVIERLNDIVIAPGGTRLPITKSFREIRNVALTLQDDGGAAVSVRHADKDAINGPLVLARDESGAGTGALIDATVQGY